MAGIDLDRAGGVIVRKHRTSNMKIFMYFADPGVYLNVHGGPVPMELAQGAGFETEKYAKLKWKRDRMTEFEKQIAAELDAEETAMGNVAPSKVLAERGGYTIIAAALGAANVLDPDGQKLNERPITVEAAELLLNHMAPVGTEAQTSE